MGSATRKNRGRQRSRRQHGGVRYVPNVGRNIWLSHLYPLSDQIISALKKIQWADYVYEGITLLRNANNDSPLFFSTPVRVASPKIPYKVLGGAACELYAKEYGMRRMLHSMVEPTADIDVYTNFPDYAEVLDPALSDVVLEDFPPIVDEKNRLTPLADHYTLWIMTQLESVLSPVAASIAHDRRITSMMPEDDNETRVSDIHTHIGKLLISRSTLVEGNMLKVQVGTKLNTEHGELASHLMEFIFLLNVSHSIMWSERDVFPVDGILVQEPLDLIQGQRKGFIDRLGTRKVFNHYTRIVFLLHLLLKLQRAGKINVFRRHRDLKWQLQEIYDDLGKGLFADPKACPPPATCNPETIQRLFDELMSIV